MSTYTAEIIKNEEFRWTQKEMTEEEISTIPYIKLFAWENKTNEAVQNYIFNERKVTMSFTNNINDPKSFYNIYDQMYVVGQKLADITVPYKGIYPYSITSNYSEISTDPTSWGSVLENTLHEMGELVEGTKLNIQSILNDTKKFANAVQFSHGKVYHKQTIKMFNSAEPNQYETTFPLFNENINFVKKHLEFILKMQSLLVPNLKTINIVELPALWRFEIPGIMVIPFGFIGKFTATPKGPSKLVDINAENNIKITIPNAWEIHIVLNSLTPPSVQMQNLLTKPDSGFGGNESIYTPKGYDSTKFSQDGMTTPKPQSTPKQSPGPTPIPFYYAPDNENNSGNRMD